MVIDYRKLNQETIKDKFHLSNIEDVLNRQKGAKIFSTIDLTSGFHQILMENIHTKNCIFIRKRTLRIFTHAIWTM